MEGALQEGEKTDQESEETKLSEQWLATHVLAILLRLKQEMDNRGKLQNPREELEERRKRAASSSAPR